MKPFETLDSVKTPEGRVLSLHRRDGGFFILLDREELMATRAPGSEVALAEFGCKDLPSKAPRVLIGGLGLGFTLRAALDVLPSAAEVVVAEVFPAVVEWNRTHLKDLQGDALSDRRTRIVTADVWNLLEEEGSFDAVLLDVDNGPQAACLEVNDRLYERAGMAKIRRALKPGGMLAVWSASTDPMFVKSLRKGGFDARAQNVRSHGLKGNRHTIFLARSPTEAELRKARSEKLRGQKRKAKGSGKAKRRGR